jgi:hypothetical protein
MRWSGEQRIGAERERVWQALQEPDILRRSLPGCERFERMGDNAFTAEAAVAVGPAKGVFRGTVRMEDAMSPESCRLSGEGDGGAVGFASGTATVRLAAEDSGTLLRYEVEVTVGGKMAQLGSRLIAAAARRLTEEFFSRFEAIVVPRPAATEAVSSPGDAPVGLPPGVWVPLLIALVAGLLLVFSRL